MEHKHHYQSGLENETFSTIFCPKKAKVPNHDGIEIGQYDACRTKIVQSFGDVVVPCMEKRTECPANNTYSHKHHILPVHGGSVSTRSMFFELFVQFWPVSVAGHQVAHRKHHRGKLLDSPDPYKRPFSIKLYDFMAVIFP